MKTVSGTVENLLPDHLDCGSRAVGQAPCLRRPLRPPCSRVFIIFGGPLGPAASPSRPAALSSGCCRLSTVWRQTRTQHPAPLRGVRPAHPSTCVRSSTSRKCFGPQVAQASIHWRLTSRKGEGECRTALCGHRAAVLRGAGGHPRQRGVLRGVEWAHDPRRRQLDVLTGKVAEVDNRVVRIEDKLGIMPR